MKALEFKSKIKGGSIKIPHKIQQQLTKNPQENVRVIVLFDEKNTQDELLFKNAAIKEFFNGYADSDSIYDN